jgi:hypothetical protein
MCDFVILEKVFYFSIVNIDDGKYWQLVVYTIFTSIIYTLFATEFGPETCGACSMQMLLP